MPVQPSVLKQKHMAARPAAQYYVWKRRWWLNDGVLVQIILDIQADNKCWVIWFDRSPRMSRKFTPARPIAHPHVPRVDPAVAASNGLRHVRRASALESAGEGDLPVELRADSMARASD